MSRDITPKIDGARSVLASAWSLFGVLITTAALLTVAAEVCGRLARSERYDVALSRVVPVLTAGGESFDATDSHLADFYRRETWNIFEPDLTLAVQQAYESSPWVRDVAVTRRFPADVEVRVELVRPFACAEWDDGQYVLVDAQGEILPSLADEPLDSSPLIRAAPPDDGKGRRRLGDEDFGWFASAVREGTAVIQDLLAHAYSGLFESVSITAVDVSNYGGRLAPRESEVVLVTDYSYLDPTTNRRRPVLVSWGRSTAHPRGLIELAVGRKLEHLEALLRHNPSLTGVAAVDVRFDDLYWRAPQPAAAAATVAGASRAKPR
jgi:hypothetical protein